MAEVTWNPWHGCHKLSEGCRHCYVYREDAMFGSAVASDVVRLTSNFQLPIKRRRDRKTYKIESGTMVFTCFTSDFFLQEADAWRIEAWKMIKERRDLTFFIITKRIDRFMVNLPDDWGEGYDNVMIGCTVENQDRADYRLPIFLKMPIKHKSIMVAPMLEKVNIQPYLTSEIEEVSVGGESGTYARVCDYEWVLDVRRQCVEADISFHFHQTGARLRVNGQVHRIAREFQHAQARKANINYRK